MYDSTEPHVPGTSNPNANPITDNQTAVYYTSVKKVRWTVPEIGQNIQVNPSAKTDTNLRQDYEIVDERTYNSTDARSQTPQLNNYEKVKTNASTNIDVDGYGYNVTTQRTGDSRNIHTDNVYNRLS